MVDNKNNQPVDYIGWIVWGIHKIFYVIFIILYFIFVTIIIKGLDKLYFRKDELDHRKPIKTYLDVHYGIITHAIIVSISLFLFIFYGFITPVFFGSADAYAAEIEAKNKANIQKIQELRRKQEKQWKFITERDFETDRISFEVSRDTKKFLVISNRVEDNTLTLIERLKGIQSGRHVFYPVVVRVKPWMQRSVHNAETLVIEAPPDKLLYNSDLAWMGKYVLFGAYKTTGSIRWRVFLYGYGEIMDIEDINDFIDQFQAKDRLLKK